MLIVLRDGPHLELSRTQAGVHTEIPGMRNEPAVLGFQELLLQEVLLVQGLR